MSALTLLRMFAADVFQTVQLQAPRSEMHAWAFPAEAHSRLRQFSKQLEKL